MSINFRLVNQADNFTTFSIFRRSLSDYGERSGITAITGGTNPEILKGLWDCRRPLWDHLSSSADQYWLFENENG